MNFSQQHTVKSNDYESIFKHFYKNGFVLISDIVPHEICEGLFKRTSCIMEKIKKNDPHRRGNRGARRYSLGSASLTGHWIHKKEWLTLLNVSSLQTLLSYLFQSTDYILRGGGGDVCLSNTSQYQPLHRDISEAWHMRDTQTKKKFVYGSFKDPRGKLTLTDLPCPYLVVNIVVQDLTPLNGPMRLIPGTHHLDNTPPEIDKEPSHLRTPTLAGVKRGSVIIRDARTWHSGTPNLTNTMRMLPNIEVYAPWYIDLITPCLPLSCLNKLNTQAQHAARFITTPDESLKTGVHQHLAWGRHLVPESPLSL